MNREAVTSSCGVGLKSEEDLVFKAASSIFRERKMKSKKRCLPWDIQKLEKADDNSVGLPRTRSKGDFAGAVRSAEGGWDPAVWEQAISSHQAPRAEKLNVPKPMDHHAAIALMKECWADQRCIKKSLAVDHKGGSLSLTSLHHVRSACLKWKQLVYRRKYGRSADTSLLFQHVKDVVYNPVDGSWAPSPGCLTRSVEWPKGLGTAHATNSVKGVFLLPFVGQSKIESGSMKDLTKMLKGYAATGIMREWNFDWGFPTVVSSMFTIVRENGDGSKKIRLIIDYRFANGIVNQIDLDLPTIKDVTAGVRVGDLFAKQDMKGGYHQMLLQKRSYHMACILFEGTVWYFTVTSFGWRDVPGKFQQHTQCIAASAKNKFSELHQSMVYMDDFFQRFGPGEESASIVFKKVIDHILSFHVVLALDKCTEPARIMEILGFLVDSENMTLSVPKGKAVVVLRKIKEILSSEKPTTLDAARVAGRLISLEPAAPLITLLVRSLYNDLTECLTRVGLVQSRTDMPKLERERDAEDNYCWRVVEMELSKTTRESLFFVLENWDKINGISLKNPLPTLLVRTDAGQDGGGITLWQVDAEGKVKFRERFHVSLSPDQMLLSSTEREAIVLSQGFRKAEEAKLLEGAVVEGVVDNQPLTQRFTNGSGKIAVQDALLLMAKTAIRCNAVWHGMWWARRYLMQSEDDISKEVQIELTIERKWFTENIMSLDRKSKPNIDLFASPENAVLERFATMQVNNCRTVLEGCVYLDGLRRPLKKRDVPWIFPPIPMITKAVKHWLNSWSMCAYLVLPRFSSGRYSDEVKRILKVLQNEEDFLLEVWKNPVIVEHPPRVEVVECLKHVVIFVKRKAKKICE
jgi:hypothetical protein